MLQLVETEKKVFSKENMSNLQTKTNRAGYFGRKLSSDVVSETEVLLDDFMAIWKLAGRMYSRLKNKLD